MKQSSPASSMPKTADGKPSQQAIDSFEMRRSGMSWKQISAEFTRRGEEVSARVAERISFEYLTWSREEARKKAEEAQDFRTFSVYDVDWDKRRITCSLPHKRDGFKNPVYVSSVAAGSEAQDSEVLDMISAMRAHGREIHGI